MSFFGKMFSGKKESTMTTGEAIRQLRETEDMLVKKQEFLEKKIDDEIAIAKKNGSKNKRGNLQSTIIAPIILVELQFFTTTVKHDEIKL